MKSNNNIDKKNLCNKSGYDCRDCSLNKKIRCEFRIKDTLLFFIPLIFIFVLSLYGMFISGFIIWIAIYLIFMSIFYFIWENRILCSHCPYYNQEGKFLRCHTHYGFYKLWQYHPESMNQSEKIQWLSGIVISFIYPLIFLILGKQYFLFLLSIVGIIVWIFIILTRSCKSCINFSCPFNRVPENVKKEYLKQNDVMGKAWKKEGYIIQ
ncbi:MAG: hypothetical protein ACFFBP_09405 [Promethearchaeota archaeon]